MVGGGTNISSEMYLHRIAESHDRNMENAPETERATRDESKHKLVVYFSIAQWFCLQIIFDLLKLCIELYSVWFKYDGYLTVSFKR